MRQNKRFNNTYYQQKSFPKYFLSNKFSRQGINESVYTDANFWRQQSERTSEIYKTSMLNYTSIVCLLNFPVFMMDSIGNCYFGLSSWEKLFFSIKKLSRQNERIQSLTPHDSVNYNFGCNMIQPEDGFITNYGSQEMISHLRTFIFYNFIVNNLYHSLLERDHQGSSELGRSITQIEREFIDRCITNHFRITNTVESASQIRGVWGFSIPSSEERIAFLDDFMNVAEIFPAVSLVDVKKCLGNYKTGTIPTSSSKLSILQPRTRGIGNNNSEGLNILNPAFHPAD